MTVRVHDSLNNVTEMTRKVLVDNHQAGAGHHQRAEEQQHAA